MSKCESHCDHTHTNAFIDLNGVPYVLAEYLDRWNFQQIDRSLIKSEINVDQSESMRAIVDISVDDIGKRASDGLPAIVGNRTKQKELLKMVADNAERFDRQLDVLKRGIILRVNYQLENQSNGQVIRSMCEDLRINDRCYFMDINPRNVDDNAIIVNFSDCMVSTINEFTHGSTRMVIRVTRVQMFYECVKKDPKMPRIKQSMINRGYPNYLPTSYGTEEDMYQYHNNMQNRHFLGHYNGNGMGWCECDDPGMISPPVWTSFNRFYHFDNYGNDIIFHPQEINDPMCKTILLGAGTINVNRAFVINPGHRIIFKFSIWKNDVTVVSNTRGIARALKVPMEEQYHEHHHHHDNNHCHNHHDPIEPDKETLIRLYHELQHTNDRQNAAINSILDRIDMLSDQIENLLLPPVEEPDNPDITNPDNPVPPDNDDPVTPPDNPDDPVTPPPNEDEGLI